jgi:hypothetical protein
MGCDIHLVLERRRKDGKWVAIDTFTGHESALDKGYAWPAATSRNYQRFAALAGVRGDGPAARGMPDDASETARFLAEEKWDSDGHTHSWLPLAEAADIFLRTHGPVEADSFAAKYPCAYFFGIDSDEGFDAYRLVFWFDN